MRVLIAGDVCEDLFVMGSCPRVSPERPCLVFVQDPVPPTSNAGMAGNVEANLRSLAPEAEIVTLYPDTRSVKTRYVDKGSNQHLLRVDRDVVAEPMRQIDFLSAVKALPDAIAVSDYGKSFLDQDSMCYIAEWGKKNGVPIFCDTKALLGEWSRSITFVKINAVEFNAQLKAGIKPWEECENLITTRGGDGIDLYNQNGEIIYHVDAHGGDVVDGAGAGDSVLAALTVSYLENGGNIKTAMEFAMKVAAVAVSKRGVVAVKREEVR